MKVAISRARETHPDKNKDPNAEKEFQQLGQAYEVLGDEQKRKRYDASRQGGVPSSFQSFDEDEFHNARDTFDAFFQRFHKDFGFSTEDDFFDRDPFAQFNNSSGDPFSGFFKRQFNDDPFFAPPSSTAGGGGRGTSESVSTSVTYKNGKKITTKRRVVTDATGKQTVYESKMEEDDMNEKFLK